MVNQAIADRMSEEGLSGFDVMQFEKDDSGSVVAMPGRYHQRQSDQKRLSLAVSESLSDTETDGLAFSIPLGNLTGLEWLSGHGPLIRCHVIYEGGLTTDLVNSFSSAGINQTHYQTLISVTASLSVAFPLAGRGHQRYVCRPHCGNRFNGRCARSLHFTSAAFPLTTGIILRTTVRETAPHNLYRIFLHSK